MPVRVTNLTDHAVLAAAAGVDVDGHTVQFQTSDGSPVREQYDLLVGADGVGSAVRAALQQHYPDMSVVVTDSGREYKTYTGLKGDIEPEGGSARQGTLCTAGSEPAGCVATSTPTFGAQHASIP